MIKPHLLNRREMLSLAAAAAVSTVLQPWSMLKPARADDQPRPKPEVLISITKNDGTVLRGQITSYDKDTVTMDVVTKPKDPRESTVIPWDDIKKVSNGLTKDKAVQKWKNEHREQWCATCHGTGKVFCATCHGTCHDPAANQSCPTCHGQEQVKCTTAKCDAGTIPCTNPRCLKLTDAGWYKKPDGLRWKKFNGPNGSYHEWSEHHVGDVIEKVNGDWADAGKCPVCGGTATIPDPVCRGTGEMPCPKCEHNTKTPACPNKCVAGLVDCPTCTGTGIKV